MTEETPASRHLFSWPRLALALVAAPLVLAAFMTSIAYLIAAAAEPTRAGTMERTIGAAWAFFLYLPLFSFTAGLAGALVLSWLGWRGRFAWCVIGAVIGAALSAGLGTISPGGVVTTHVIVFTLLGLILMSLIRGFAGVRDMPVSEESGDSVEGDATP